MNSAKLHTFVHDTFERCDIRLLTTSSAALNRHTLPTDSRVFLSEVGLPDGEPFNFDFTLAVRLPTIAEAARDQRIKAVVPELCRDWPCVAWAYGSVLTLDPRVDAAARLIDLNGKNNPLFVNSRVELLGASLAHYVALRVGPDAPPADKDRQHNLTERLTKLDPACLAREDGWWQYILDEVGYGLS
jgi:hypothetical protein